MSLQTFPYLLVYLFAFVISGIVFAYAWKNRSGPGITAFAISVAFEISWLIGYVIEINVPTLEAKLFWDNFQYIGAFFTPIALLVFALQFTGKKINVRWLTLLLSIVPVITILALFFDLQPELLHVNAHIVPGTPYNELTYEFGSFLAISNYFLYVLSFSYIIVLLTGYVRKERNYRTQLSIIILGTSIPIIGLIFAISLGLKFANQRDISPLMFAISNAVIAFGIFRFRLFNIIPIAREALFETIEDVLVILDTEDRIVDANSSARYLLPTTSSNLNGMSIRTLLPELYRQFQDVLEVRTEIENAAGATYDLKITPLYDRTGHYLGRLINAHDITIQKNAEKEQQATSEQNQRRAAQFQAIANVASATTTLKSQEETLSQITQTISEQFGHYHVGIFLLDSTNLYAILRASNSEGGKRMLERDHRLKIGEVGIVGNVASSGVPRIALDTGGDAKFFDNPDLPNTRSEVALPLTFGGAITGVLDVQSTEPNAFTNDDINSLTVLANQVSITIQNTRLYEENILALQNAEKAYRQLAGETWGKVSNSQSLKGYVYDGIESQPLVQSFNGKHSIVIPVQIRGKSIGALKLDTTESNRTWNDDEIAIITAAAERAALALENARLLEASQRQAAKERTISEGTARVSAGFDLESILKATAEELERALGGSDLIIELESKE